MIDHHCVAVHGGAGSHSPSSDHELKKALKRACKQSLATLTQGAQALNAVQDAICVLEDDDSLNAGYGSNLTLDGHVECDAGVMDGLTGDFASVGAVSGVQNPISLARAVLDYSRTPDPIGRIPPLTLVGSGAHAFASTTSVKTVPQESLIAPRALAEWRSWKHRLETASAAAVRNDDDKQSVPAPVPVSGELQDTVGAVALDTQGNMAAGVSSGGILLKRPGRVGEAAVFGAGCWAIQGEDGGRPGSGLACSVSGAGEHITRTMLARVIGDALSASPDADPHEILRWALVDVFWKACRERGISECNAGILLLTREHDAAGEYVPRLWCAFTTTSMAIAYASSRHPIPKALVLRRSTPPENGENPSLYITAVSL